MGADREQVGSQPIEVDDGVTGGGRRVHVGQQAVLAGPGDDLGHGLEGPHLVVAPLAVDESELGGIELDHGFHPHPAPAVHRRLDDGGVATGRVAHR